MDWTIDLVNNVTLMNIAGAISSVNCVKAIFDKNIHSLIGWGLLTFLIIDVAF